MNPIDENNPIGDNENELTEGSYQAIKGSEPGEEEENADQKEAPESKKDSFTSITDIQEGKDADSQEDAARSQGPYGVQE